MNQNLLPLPDSGVVSTRAPCQHKQPSDNGARRRSLLANRLRTARTEAGYRTYADAETASGVPSATIASYELGRYKPGIDTLTRLAGAYGVSLDYLVGSSDKPEVTAGTLVLVDVTTIRKILGTADSLKIRRHLDSHPPSSLICHVPRCATVMSHTEAAELRSQLLAHVRAVAPDLLRAHATSHDDSLTVSGA